MAHHGLAARAILHTYAHFDHVGATGELQKVTGAPVYLHEGDLPLLQALGMQARMFGVAEPEAVEVDRFLADEQTVRVGELSAAVLHTPGHTPGSLSFLVAGGPVVSGDTLFAGSIGRSDLWGGDHDALLRSIRDRLLCLDDDTQVVPGHGPITTIGQEKRWNPFLRGLSSGA